MEQRMRKHRHFKRSAPDRKASQSEKHTNSSASQDQPPIIIHVANPAAFGGQGSIIMLELADENAAKRVALKIARETGRRVTMRKADMTVIQAIPAAKVH
jgi:hypothetical protein